MISGQDRTGQDRTGQDWVSFSSNVPAAAFSLITYKTEVYEVYEVYAQYWDINAPIIMKCMHGIGISIPPLYSLPWTTLGCTDTAQHCTVHIHHTRLHCTSTKLNYRVSFFFLPQPPP